MNILDILKSRGLVIFVLLFVLLNGLIALVMKEFRAYWTLGFVEIIAVFFYIVIQLIPSKDEPLWVFKPKE